MARTDGSNLRSKEDNERLARQKKKNPTDIQRAKQLAQQYSNKHNFDNTVRVKQQVGNKKWYSGAQPTGRETYAQMYRVADGNRQKFQELEAKYDQERRTIGSPVYNPYADATNYKAIQGLEELGYDLSGGVTGEWITANLGILNDKRTTTTGYNAAAPTKKSSSEQNAAYWLQSLANAEERTQSAETELGNLASEVKYWAERGYSDDAIIKKVRDGFDSKYKTLNGMDEDRLSGSATILNRAIDYCGDDTLYGMIWAARNGGGTGNYFTDSVKYTLGQGKLYTRDVNSEAARDPSDYESYDPYSIGGTMHDANQRYGVNAFDDKWLEAHRDMLSGTEADAKAWRDIYESVETANTATQELAKLDEWVRNRVEMGYSADDICDDLAARFSGEDQYGSSQYPTLAKMERYRALGSYIDLGYAVDFTLPGYQKRVRDMVEERDAAAQAEAEAKAAAKAERANAVSDAVSGAVTAVGEAGRAAWKWLAGDRGALEDVVNAQKSGNGEAQVMTIEDIAKNYAKQMFGVEITGKLLPHEEAAIRDAIGKANLANLPRTPQEDIDAANVAAAALQDVFTGIISDPARIVSGDAAAQEQTKAASGNDYRSSIAYKSVLGASDMEQPREGMADMSAETTAATAEAGDVYKPGTAGRNSPEAEAYEKMLSGGEWDGNTYVWALNKSTNRAGIEVELIDGIKDIMSGRVRADGAGLAGAWYRQHAAMISGMAYGQSGIAILDNTSGQRQSAPVQDERLSAALDANDRAQEIGAISADDYVRNLIALGDTYDIINGMSGDAESVYAQFPAQLARVERIQADCEDAISAYRQQEDEASSAMQSEINAMLDRYLTGGDVSDAEAGFIDAIYASDISAVAGSDSGYRDASAYIRNATSAESILNSGMSFTTGNTEIDGQMDYMTLQQTGATVYAQGVYGLASHKLDNAMREAAAYGMSLDEYYAAYPDRARTPEQIIAEAQAEYKAVWSEFGSTISGLYAANDTLEKADANESAAVNGEDSLTFAQSVELGVAAAVESTDFTISLRKAFAMLTYGALTSEESKAQMRIAYMNDPAAARSALEKYLGTLPEGSDEYKELKAKLDTYTDIFDIGMTVPIMKNENAISASEQNTQAIQATVEKYGTDADKTAFNISQSITSSAFQMDTALLAQSLGVGGFASQLIAASGEATDNAYELNEQTGNLALSLAASSATWVANSAIEHSMELGYIDNSILSKSKAMLYKRGISDMSLKAPGALSNVAKKALYITATQLAETGANAAGEGVTESLQQLIESVITNSAKNISGVRSGAILTGEDIKQIGEAGVMGAATSPILGAMVSAATSDYTGIMAEPFVDIMGNVLSSAEAQLNPDYEGKIINAAVDTEANVRAMESAQADLGAITGSAEYAEATQAETELSEAGSTAEEALRSLNDAQAEADAAASALADLDAQMNSDDVFTADMGKRMGELSKRIAELKDVIAQRTEAFSDAQQRLDAAKARSAQADSAMRRLYDSIMEKYRSEARQAVIDELFAGDSDAARAAEEAYLAKTAELTAAQNRLRSAKADMELYGRGTARGDNAQTVYYSTREEVEALAEEVRQLKAEADAAYLLTPEANVGEALGDDMEVAAIGARQMADADPQNERKQMYADLTAAERDAAAAQAAFNASFSDIASRMQSMDPDVRSAALDEYDAAERKASEAHATAAQLRNDYERAYSASGRLQSAIGAMRQYTPDDLLNVESKNHAEAQAAYARLEAAMRDADISAAQAAVNEALLAIDPDDPETIQAYKDAKAKAKAVSNEVISTYPSSGLQLRDLTGYTPEAQQVITEYDDAGKYIDDRAYEDTSDVNIKPFYNANRNLFKEYILTMAESIRSDVINSIPGERIFVKGGKGNGYGSDVEVIGVKRLTTDLIAEYKDAFHWTWDITRKNFDRFIAAIESDKPLPNTANIKRVELMVDEALTNGYTDIRGEQFPPSYDYIQAKSGMSGRVYANKEYANNNGETFYDMFGVGSPITPRFLQDVKEASAQITNETPKLPNGGYILEIGNKYVYTDGNKDNPRIDRVITFLDKGYDEDFDYAVREGLYKVESTFAPEEVDEIRRENLAVISEAIGTGDSFRTYDIRYGKRSEAGTGIGTGSNGSADGEGAGSKISYKRDSQILNANDGGWRDHRQSGRTGDTTTADRNPVEILSDLTRSISVGYNPGGSMSNGNRRLPRAVRGFYDERARSITTRTSEAGDLATGLHEFGHAVQARLPELRANQQLLDGLSQQVRDAYRPGELDGEAIAEFVCEYIYNRDGAIMMAGEEFVRNFESMIGQDTALYNAVMDASDQTELWNNADIDSKVRAMVKDGQDPRRGRIGGFIERTLRDIETNIADLTAPADMVSREFRKKALYSLHARRRADVMFTKYMIDPQGRRIGESLAERLYNAGVTEENMDAVLTFALERHALDRLAQNKPVFDTHEFPESELRARVDEIIRTRPDIVAGADAIVKYWKDFMDAWWVETGMIDADDMAKMREMYPNYVPTFRVMDKNFRDYGGRSARFSIRGAVKGGSSLEVINPINSLVRMTQQVVSTVSQNQLMREFHAEMQRGGLGEIAERVDETMAVQRTDTSSLEQTLQAINETGSVDPALMDDAFAEMANLQERWYGTGQNYGANVVSGVDEYGSRFFYRIKPGAEGLYRMLSGEAMSGAGYGNTMKLARNFKNAFTRVTTSSNPLFAIRNATRDLQSSTNTGTHSLFYVDGMVRFLGALKDVMLQTDEFNDWFSMGGGDHTRLRTGIDINGGDSVSRALTKELTSGRRDRKGRFAMRRSVLDRISNVMTLEGFNNAIENANRFVEYKYGKHDLSTHEGRVEAYMASQDVTVNFGTHGASKIIRGLSSIVPFMNATIQGVNKDYNIIKDVITGDEVTRRQALPKLGKTIMNNMLTAAVQYALLRGIFDGEEDDEDYAILNQEMRVGNIIVPIPKAVMEAMGNAVGFDKPYIRIPVAQSQIGQMLYAVSLDAMANVADYSPMEVDLWRAAMSIVSDAIPDGTVFQGISDVINNRTWYGGAIDSEYALSKSAINRYDSETAGLFKYMGKALGVSPAKIEYLATQYSGYYGRVLIPFISNDRLDADSGWTLSGGLRNAAYNVLKSYTIDPVSTNDLDSSYSAAKDIIGQIVTDGKAGLPMGNVAYSADGYSAYMAAVQLQKEFNAIDKEISALWRDYSDVESSRLDRYEKVSKMRRIRRDYINQRIMDAIALYDEYKMEYIDADTLATSLKGALSTYINHPTVD